MKIAIRVDASTLIGSGHVMRCLTLAESLRNRGAEVLFICRELSGHLCSLIEDCHYPVARLACNSGEGAANGTQDWLGASYQDDAEQTIAVLHQDLSDVDWLIVDHYAIDYRWEKMIRSAVPNIFVIDDLADREHDCDLLLDQNYYVGLETRYKGLIPDNCITLLGPHYALLRDEFLRARTAHEGGSESAKSILIMYGGVDATNETSKALTAIKGLQLPDLLVDVVVGASCPHKHEIEVLCRTLPGARFHCQVDNVSELMLKANISLGAGGTITWERCCLGLPAIVSSLAANQTLVAEDCARAGIHLYLGMASSVTVGTLQSALQVFLNSPTYLQHISAQARQIVDGLGCSRVVATLLPVSISLRRAKLEDCQDIYNWRNDKETRRYIFDQEVISYNTHQRWFVESMQNPNRVLLIGENDGNPTGVLRYDFREQDALISIYLVPGGQPRGAGSQLIRQGSLWLRQNHPNVKRVKAEIMEQNLASRLAFEKAGYQLENLNYYINLDSCK